MSFKTSSLFALALISFGVLLPAVLVYVVDPYQIYHKRIIFKEAGYGSEEFYQHAGWINQLLTDPSQHYQSIVIGPSTMSNYTSSMIDDILHWGSTLNLSFHGGFPKMSAVAASDALRQSSSIKHILWDIHLYYTSDDPNLGGDGDFPFYLYNKNLMDDRPYLFNVTNVASVFRFMRGDYEGFGHDIEHNGPFYQDLLTAGRFDIFKSINYRRNVMLPTLQHFTYTPLDASSIAAFRYPSVDKNLLRIIMPLCNSDTDIKLIFSPYIRYFYSSQADTHYVYSMIYMRRYVVEKVSACKNISVFAFDNEDNIAANLDRYADNFHFDTGVNGYILTSIAEGTHQLTMSNIEAYEKTFMEKLTAYPDFFSASLNK